MRRLAVFQRLCYILFTMLFAAQASGAKVSVDDLAGEYLERWSAFYPTAALAQGKQSAAGRFEDYGPAATDDWLAFNHDFSQTLAAVEGPLDAAARADIDILRRQVAEEIMLWERTLPLRTRPEWYAGQVSQALTYLLVRESIPAAQKQAAVMARLRGIRALCEQGRRELTSGNRLRTEGAMQSLEATGAFYRNGLADIVSSWDVKDADGGVAALAGETADSIQALRQHLADRVLPTATSSPSLGEQRYSELLSLRSGGRLTPGELARDASQEIERVRALMVETASDWWKTTRSDQPRPESDDDLLGQALAAMERDRDDNLATFERGFTDLTHAAESFVREHQLATVPEPTTLYIALSPKHFAGAAVGGVYPAGPYAPGDDTLFYLPSIPADASPETAEGFFRSFNRHFNTMIISHEMFPGHYMQYKVAVNSAPPLRSIFADGAYVEGWGSFSEQLMLKAGWGNNDPLTWLAHYRKRLENATRSYVSVMVHTRGWGQAEVADFAVTRGLLAPQFAINLWQRVVNSPMQITDYFVGYRQFQALWQSRRNEAGEAFDQRAWVDAVLRAGPVPMAALDRLLR